MYAQPTHQNQPGYGAAQNHIASIVQDTVMRLKDLDVRLEVVNQELAQLCDAVGAPQVAQLARTPVQAFLPGASGAPAGNVPQIGAANYPNLATGNPWAANLSPFTSSPFANTFASSPYLGAAIDPANRWNASAINAFSPVSGTIDPYSAWNAPQNVSAFGNPYAATNAPIAPQNVPAFGNPYAATNTAIAPQNVSAFANPYAATNPAIAGVQTPFTTGFIR